ncbi:MAG: hypothetical protein EXX96DRAFT_477581 [Benjaminiella poitrasii]|nr:MAG: hypothetical protein EXX96DRAFT_477581 [Benjaminiella poitrasii]
MLHTFIILDGHPDVFTPLAKLSKHPVDPTHQLPAYPLWTSMVQSCLDFCRVVWDVQHSNKYLINVFVAGETPVLLNKTTEQDIRVLQRSFPHAQPRQSYPHDRMQVTIESALRLYQENINDQRIRRCRIVLITLAKDSSEKKFDINHVQIDVLRSLTYSVTREYLIQNKIISKTVTPQITMSTYSIPNGQDDLKYTMRHLAQLYYNINTLHISNIPMKSATEQGQSTHTITLYYQSNGHHLINQQDPLRNSLIHDPAYLKYRDLKLIYSKRSKRSLPATQVYLDMTFKGSISYLVTPELSHGKTWTHTLMAEDGIIFLRCLNNQLLQQFTEAKNQAISLSKVKIEGFTDQHKVTAIIPKTIELSDSLIRPNLFDNIKQLLHETALNPLCNTMSYNPSRYSYYLPITHSTITLNTTRFIEKSTRWRTCFRDCEGTNLFPITNETQGPIKDLAFDVLNAWSQLHRYENMSLREKDDAVQGSLPELKSEPTTNDTNMLTGQLPPHLQAKTDKAPPVRFNPNFRNRRGQNALTEPYPSTNRRQIYPNPSAAVPYLTYVAPTLEEKAQEEKEEEESLGKPGNLLWLYWMNDKLKKRGHHEEGELNSGTELVYKDHQWKRVKKEFLGRLAQPGEKGEMP